MLAETKVISKGKAKATGRGRGRPSGQGKVQSVSKAPGDAEAAIVDPSGEAGQENGEDNCQMVAVVEMPKRVSGRGAGGLRKKLLSELGDKPLDVAIEELRANVARADAVIAGEEQKEQAEEAKVAVVQAEYDKVREEVMALILAEQEAARAFRKTKDGRGPLTAKVVGAKKDVLEAQKKVAMLQVVAANAEKMKELVEKRRMATEAAADAKRKLAEQKKEAMEVRKQLFEEARQLDKQRKAIGRGAGATRKRRATTEIDAAEEASPTGEAKRRATDDALEIALRAPEAATDAKQDIARVEGAKEPAADASQDNAQDEGAKEPASDASQANAQDEDAKRLEKERKAKELEMARKAIGRVSGSDTRPTGIPSRGFQGQQRAMAEDTSSEEASPAEEIGKRCAAVEGALEKAIPAVEPAGDTIQDTVPAAGIVSEGA